MTDVAKRVNLTQIQTENLIQEMVDRKEIKAEIEMHENSRIVCFGTDDSKRKTLPEICALFCQNKKKPWQRLNFGGGVRVT